MSSVSSINASSLLKASLLDELVRQSRLEPDSSEPLPHMRGQGFAQCRVLGRLEVNPVDLA